MPACAAALAALVHARARWARPVRRALAAVLTVNELAGYTYAIRAGWVVPPNGLPLDLCDVVVWLTIWALVAPRQWALELIYFLGLAGTGMAVATPDIDDVPWFAVVTYFVRHGGVVAAILFLVWSGALRSRPGAWWRAFLTVNLYAAFIMLFNLRFGTNYMYLSRKPQAGSLLDLLGPWPWYLAGAELVAIALLWGLDRPFRRGRRG